MNIYKRIIDNIDHHQNMAFAKVLSHICTISGVGICLEKTIPSDIYDNQYFIYAGTLAILISGFNFIKEINHACRLSIRINNFMDTNDDVHVNQLRRLTRTYDAEFNTSFANKIFNMRGTE